MAAQRSTGPFTVFPSHPDRGAALEEAHARPTLPVPIPATLDLLVLVPDGPAGGDVLLHDLLDGPIESGARHAIRTEGRHTLKWERHTEFVSLTVLRPGAGRDLEFEERIARSAQGARLLGAVRAIVTDEVPQEAFGGRFKDDVIVASSFRIGPDGFVTLHVKGAGVGPAQLGRRVQRLLELEVYRTAALLGLPLARAEGVRLSDLENAVSKATQALSNGDLSDEEALSRLRPIAAELEAMRSRTRYRFGASQAYAVLVEERLEALGEEKIGSTATISGFVRTRLAPAMRTIASVEARQRSLSEALSRSLDILRTQIDLRLATANKEILASMDRRQYQQLVLSETVEGLSVIAVSYYLLGLLGYALKAWEKGGTAPASATTMLAVAVPVTVVGVFLAVRTVRTRIKRGLRDTSRPSR